MTTSEKTAKRIESIGNEDTNSNPNIARSANIKNDYLLLRNYKDNIFPMRRILLKTAIESFNQIEEGKFSVEDVSEIKVKAKSMFQMEIISYIMLYIEDLIVLSESFRSETSYYKLLDPSDENQNVGKIIEGFFKDVNSFPEEEFRRIFGYMDPSQLNLKEGERKLAEKIIQKNIAEMRRVFVIIRKFGKAHHPAFRRFKHAGSPLLLGMMPEEQENTPLPGFDSYTHVSIGKDPFQETIILPLSKDVLEGYRIIIHGVQSCLPDLVTNHIACIQRNVTGILPTETYFQERLSEQEGELYKKIVDKFYEKYPLHMDDLQSFHLKPKIKKEKILWQLNLSDFLRECEIRVATSESS